MNWKTSVIALSLLPLYGCASSAPLCPPLGADLAQPYPPPGWFSQQLELILKCGQDETSDPRCEAFFAGQTK